MDENRQIRVQSELINDSKFCFKIIDNGPGISEEMADKLFEAFESDKPSGCGIGLSISNKLVERNGGSLGFDQDCEIGTAFVCRFPLVEDKGERLEVQQDEKIDA